MRALIVDDVPSMRHFLAMALAEIRGLELLQAGDGMEALRLATENHLDLLLLDLNLPLLDGLKVLATLRGREESRDVPVIMITTTSDAQARERAQALGARFLAKPVRLHEVRDVAHELLKIDGPRSLCRAAERRREPRLHIPAKVHFEPRDSDRGERQLLCEDINAFGAFLVTSELERVGSRGTVRIELPHLSDPIVVACTVVHVRPLRSADQETGFGVRFDPADEKESLRLVQAFVSPADPATK